MNLLGLLEANPIVILSTALVTRDIPKAQPIPI